MTTKQILQQVSRRVGEVASFLDSVKADDLEPPKATSAEELDREKTVGWVLKLVMDDGKCTCPRCLAVMEVAEAIRTNAAQLDARTEKLIKATCGPRQAPQAVPAAIQQAIAGLTPQAGAPIVAKPPPQSP